MLDLGSQIGHRFSLYVFMLGVVLRNDRLFFLPVFLSLERGGVSQVALQAGVPLGVKV